MQEARRSARRPRGALDGVLDAIADGRLSVQEALGALRRGGDGSARLRQLASRALHREPQQIQIRRRSTAPPPYLAAAQRRLRATLPPSIHVGRGRHYTRGLATEHFGLVAYVPAKQPLHLVPERDRIRGFIAGRHAGAPYRIAVDVKQIPFARKHASIRPSNCAVVGTTVRHGSLSGVVAIGGEYAALLSGHVAAISGAEIVAREANGSLVELGVADPVRDDATMDAAVVRGIPAAAVPLLTLDPTALRPVSEIHTDLAVFVVRSDRTTRKTFVDDIDMPVAFPGGAMSDLLGLSPCVTGDGDSGAAILDDAGNVLAFVVGGSDTHTYAIPATEVLSAMLHL